MDIRYDVPRKPPCLESGTYLSIYQHPSIHSRGLSSGIPTVPEYKSQDPNSIAAGLLFTFWGCMEFISVDGYGYGNYTPDGNLAEWIDRTLLGRFRDAATVQDGQVVFAPWYRYTWILSSLNFAVTTLTGLFAGYILKDKTRQSVRKFYLLAVIGVLLVAAGWLWSFQMPVIKKLWTSSMVLQTSDGAFC